MEPRSETRKIIDFAVLSDDSSGALRKSIFELIEKGWELGQFAAVWRPFQDSTTGEDGYLIFMQTMILFEDSPVPAPRDKIS